MGSGGAGGHVRTAARGALASTAPGALLPVAAPRVGTECVGGAARVGAALGDHPAGGRLPSGGGCRRRGPASVSPRAHQPSASQPAYPGAVAAGAGVHAPCLKHPTGQGVLNPPLGGLLQAAGRPSCRGLLLESGGALWGHRTASRHGTSCSLRCLYCGGGGVLFSAPAARSDLQLRLRLGRGLAVQSAGPHPARAQSPHRSPHFDPGAREFEKLPP